MLLSGMGIDTDKIGTEDFTKEEAEKMLSVFERTKQLYLSGKLRWHYGKILDQKHVYGLLQNQDISAMEILMVYHRSSCYYQRIRTDSASHMAGSIHFKRRICQSGNLRQ